jgi:glutamine cyclotransferase
MKRIIGFAIILSLFFMTCKKEEKKVYVHGQTVNAIKATIEIQGHKNAVSKGEKIKVLFSTKQKIDSVHFSVNDSLIISSTDTKTSFEVGTDRLNHYGINYVKAQVFAAGQQTTVSDRFVLFPSTEPKWYTYKIKKVYPHDSHAYTQGLVYHDNILYESTGLKGESSIRKVRLETGEVIQSYTIEPNFFGEGIALWGDSLIQLTWQAHRGFVYDKNSFQKLGEFYYSTEGWGLTQDGNYLIMSDGTNHLYYLSPQTFAVVKTVEVYDNRGPVSLLNELEYINGRIFANIYTKDLIAIINPESGLVEAYIDMKGLLPASDRKPGTDVLNGIAYDAHRGRLFVTGKNWPKLFWIELVPKH